MRSYVTPGALCLQTLKRFFGSFCTSGCLALSVSLGTPSSTCERFFRRSYHDHDHSRACARQVKDCSLPILADLFFIILVLWGAFFTLNLLLAVLETNFSQDKESEVIILSVWRFAGGVFMSRGTGKSQQPQPAPFSLDQPVSCKIKLDFSRARPRFES